VTHMKRLSMAAAGLLLAGCLSAQNVAQNAARDRNPPRLVWDTASLTLVQAGGVYGRMLRLPDQRILCSYERGSRVWVRASRDEGRTWDTEIPVAAYPFGGAANPEMLVLQNGWILLSYNERPRDGVHPFTIMTTVSKDNGATWEAPQLVYEAGINSGTGCWEPAQIQLASGEIQLYFANEKPYPNTTEQEISMVRSLDNAATWSLPQRVSFRPGFRDGMPVPIILPAGKGVVFAIEDNGMAGKFKPAIVDAAGSRWPALHTQLPDSVYAGAPYLRQFPGGETVLSFQSGEGRLNEGTQNNSQMVVYLGDADATNFTAKSVPFPVAPEASGLWNAVFIKDEVTVTAITGTVIDGVRGLWAIDGRLENGKRSARRRQ
jgi:hypothetical protein